MDFPFFGINLFLMFISIYSSVLGQHLLLTSNVSVVAENNPLLLTCVLPSNGANTGWIVNGVRTETALLDDGTCVQPSPPPQGFIYTCVNSTAFTLTILQVKRLQDGDQWKCDAWINGGTLYSNTVDITVQVPISSVSIINPAAVNSVDIVENGTTFTCQTSEGIPAARVTWYMTSGSSETAITTGVTSSQNKSEDKTVIVTSTLTYTGMRVDNGSKVFCRASNIHNEVKKSARAILLNILTKPETPKYFHSANQAAPSVMFYWLTGFNGGRSQTFYIEYREVDSNIWNNVSIDEENSISCLLMNATVDNLSPSTEYQARMYAKNTVGVSQPVEPITFRTLEDRVTQKSMSQIGSIVGGTVPGVILVVVLVGLVYLRLTYNFKKKGQESDTAVNRDWSSRNETNIRVREGLSAASPAQVQLHFGARYFPRQKTGDPANVVDTSAQKAVHSKSYQAKMDHIPDRNRYVDLPLSPDNTYLELKADNPYDFIPAGGLRPKMALPSSPDVKRGQFRGNEDGDYLTPVNTRISRSSSM